MEKKILSSIIPSNINNRELVLKCRARLLTCMEKEISFKSKTNSTLYKIVVSYYQATRSFFEKDILKDIMVDNQLDPELISDVLILFQNVVSEDFSDEKFDFYLNRFLELRERETIEKTLLESLEELKSGASDLEGNTPVSKVKEKLISTVFSGDSLLKGDIPSGNIFDEADDIQAEYEILKETGGVDKNGILTGIDRIDRLCGPMVKGDLVVVAAGSGVGKSFMAANMAWHAAVVQHKNVILFTAETAREKYRRRLIVRHSNLAKFGQPISASHYKTGDFDPQEQEVFGMVIEDLKNSDYGSLDLVQIGAGTDLSTIASYCEKQALVKEIDMVIIDYLSLLKPIRHRGSAREEIAEMFKDAKHFGITFNKGKGVVCVCLHQISFQAVEKARFEPGKCFTLASLADSSEAGKSADSAIALYCDDEMASQMEIGCQLLKVRDADFSNPNDSMFKLLRAYDNGLIANLQD